MPHLVAFGVWSSVGVVLSDIPRIQGLSAGGMLSSPPLRWLSAVWNDLCWLGSWPLTDVSDLHHQAVLV